MIPQRIRVRYSGTAAMVARGAHVTTRLVREWMQDAYIAALRRWHQEYRPKHFRESAKGEYDYEPRQEEYEEAKRGDVKHTRPLVYSGESERATQRVVYRVTARSGKASMDAGNLSWNPPRGRVKVREELVTTTAREEYYLGRTFDRVITREMRNHKDSFAWPRGAA